jgi:hypothetical protein
LLGIQLPHVVEIDDSPGNGIFIPMLGDRSSGKGFLVGSRKNPPPAKREQAFNDDDRSQQGTESQGPGEDTRILD